MIRSYVERKSIGPEKAELSVVGPFDASGFIAAKAALVHGISKACLYKKSSLEKKSHQYFSSNSFAEKKYVKNFLQNILEKIIFHEAAARRACRTFDRINMGKGLGKDFTL